MRPGTVAGIACAALLLAPTPAWAAPEFDAPATLSTVTGALTLLLAVALLLTVVRLSRVAAGSAIAGKIAFVVAGSLCLAFSVLLGFFDRFVASWLTADQVRAGADILVFMAMLFFAMYFNAVRRALEAFLGHLSTDDAADMPADFELAEAHADANDG